MSQPASGRVLLGDQFGVRTATLGTAIWLFALVLALANHQSLAERDRSWWIWTAAAGVGLGLIGIAFLALRRQRLQRTTKTNG